MQAVRVSWQKKRGTWLGLSSTERSQVKCPAVWALLRGANKTPPRSARHALGLATPVAPTLPATLSDYRLGLAAGSVSSWAAGSTL